jgi:3'-phosphoadenosine 5'-phosphosulfate sulfotransferase (PAPS reductase)/FAD synthetase
MTSLVTRHVLGISGGKDSAALAVHMKKNFPDIPMEYFFTDTGSELPEVYDFLSRLEAFLGQNIIILNSDRKFDYWLKRYKNYLPSVQQRWCTIQMKLKPFEDWIKPTLVSGGKVVSYVAIRSDENRSGYRSDVPEIEVKFPLRDANIDKSGVTLLLKDAALNS